MKRKWYCCTKCQEVASYIVDDETGETTFPRGEFLGHNDYITTGFDSKKAAEKGLKKYSKMVTQ